MKNTIISSIYTIKESVIIPTNNSKSIFEVTTIKNQLDIINSEKEGNYPVIDLKECGDLLKSYYNLDPDTDLIILKYENNVDDINDKSVQYEVYAPNMTEKLNLSICTETNVNIEIYVPVQLDEETKQLYEELKEQGYNLFDKNDKFYTDICTPFKSANGTDVSLADRYNTFYANNQLSCQANCKYSELNLDSNYLKCDCSVVNTEEIETKESEKFSANSLTKSLFKVLKYSNYKVLKCYKLVFRDVSFYKNIGSILALLYFLGYIISFFIFLYKKLLYIKEEIGNVFNQRKVEDINNAKTIKSSDKKLLSSDKNIKHIDSKKHKKEKNKIGDTNELEDRKKKVKSKSHRHKKAKYDFENKNHKDFPPKRKVHFKREDKNKTRAKTHIETRKSSSSLKKLSVLETHHDIDISNQKNDEEINENYEKNLKTEDNFKVKEKKEKEKEIESKKLSDFEYNNLEYLEAMENDNRNFFQSLLVYIRKRT